MKKRIAAVLTAILLTLTCLCSVFPAVAEELFPLDTGSTYLYDRLDANAQKLYDGLLAAAKAIDTDTATYKTTGKAYYSGLNDDAMQEVIVIFMYDHPEFFWLGNSYNYGTDRRGNYASIDIYEDYQDGAARQETRTAFLTEARRYLDAAMAYDTDYDRANYLATQLRADCAYADSALSQSAVSCLIGKSTVCAGFTKSFSLIANAAGVETISMLSPSHGWNGALIGGHWYHVDVTNRLFLLSDDEMVAWDDAHPANKTTVTKNGVTTTYGMHARSNEYYDDIYPVMDQTYDDAVTVLSGTTVPSEPPATEPITTEPPATEPPTTEPLAPTGYRYYWESLDSYHTSEDTTPLDLEALIANATYSTITADGTPITTEALDLSACALPEGWRTPAEIWETCDGDCQDISVPVIFPDGEQRQCGSLWIAPTGDADLDGIPTAGDASEMLVFATEKGAGRSYTFPAVTSTDLMLLVRLICDLNGDGNIDAVDASLLLVQCTERGVGH